jgi:hypothetical protein
MNVRISAWEDEGGAVIPIPELSAHSLTGTESQVEWAERIRRLVNDEFDRVAKSFRSVADAQSIAKRTRTEAILAILEDKRRGVMSRTEAGYFIRDWQEIGDQVRQMIGNDVRYKQLKTANSRREV